LITLVCGEDEDGGQRAVDAVRTAADFGQDVPTLEGGDGALADTADLRVVMVERLAVADKIATPVRGPHCAAGADVALVSEGCDRCAGQRGDETV